MNQKISLLVLLGILGISQGCGKNQGRNTEQSAGAESSTEMSKSESEVEIKTLALKDPVEIQGYLVLGVVESTALPQIFARVDNGTAIGTLDGQVENRTYSSFYSGDRVEPKVMTDTVSSVIPVFLIRLAGYPTAALFAISDTPLNHQYLTASENILVRSSMSMKRVEIAMPARPHDNIHAQIVHCDLQESCVVLHYEIRGINNIVFVAEKKAAWDVLRDYSGCWVQKLAPAYAQEGTFQNTRKLVRVRIALKNEFSSSGLKRLYFQTMF